MKKKIEEIERRIKRFYETCRHSGIKATHQRTEIYREIVQTGEHPDVETLYDRVRKRIPTISLDTVYRTLRLFEKQGMITRVGSLGERTRFDANTNPHHHFICTRCGVVGDFYSREWNNFQAPEDVAAMGKVNSVHVELRGFCKVCQTKRRNKE